MTPESEGFRVTDRRGRREEAGPGAGPQESRAQGRQAPEPGAPPGEPREPQVSAGQPRVPETPPRPAPEPEAAPRSSRVQERPGPDLAALFMMFASSALIALGEAPDPVTGERTQDPEQAREAIDLLLLLRDKTEGHRSPEESRLLENLLYDLQMRFLGLGRPAH